MDVGGMDGLVERLESDSDASRLEAVEDLSESLSESDWILPEALFTIIADRLFDLSYHVALATVELLCEMLGSGAAMHSALVAAVLPGLIAGLSDSRLRSGCMTTLSKLVELPDDDEGPTAVLSVVISEHGLHCRDARMREHCAGSIYKIFRSSFFRGKARDIGDLVEALVECLRDPENGVVSAAEMALGHLRSADRHFNEHVGALSKGLRTVYEQHEARVSKHTHILPGLAQIPPKGLADHGLQSEIQPEESETGIHSESLVQGNAEEKDEVEEREGGSVDDRESVDDESEDQDDDHVEEQKIEEEDEERGVEEAEDVHREAEDGIDGEGAREEQRGEGERACSVCDKSEDEEENALTEQADLDILDDGSKLFTDDDDDDDRMLRKFARESLDACSVVVNAVTSTKEAASLALSFLPEGLIEVLRDRSPSAWKARLGAIDQLNRAFQSMTEGQIEEMRVQAGETLALLSSLLSDANFKVSITTLQIVANTMAMLGPSVQPHLHCILPGLVLKLGDNKVVIRETCMRRVFTQLLSVVGPAPVLRLTAPSLSDSNWRVRKAVVHIGMLGLLTAPDWDVAGVDLGSLAAQLTPLLADTQPSVSHAANEALAVVQHRGKGRVSVRDLAERHGATPALLQRLQARLDQPETTLPTVDANGNLEYAETHLPPPTPAVGRGGYFGGPASAAAATGTRAPTADSASSARFHSLPLQQRAMIQEGGGVERTVTTSERPRRHPTSGRAASRALPWDMPDVQSRRLSSSRRARTAYGTVGVGLVGTREDHRRGRAGPVSSPPPFPGHGIGVAEESGIGDRSAPAVESLRRRIVPPMVDTGLGELGVGAMQWGFESGQWRPLEVGDGHGGAIDQLGLGSLSSVPFSQLPSSASTSLGGGFGDRGIDGSAPQSPEPMSPLRVPGMNPSPRKYPGASVRKSPFPRNTSPDPMSPVPVRGSDVAFEGNGSKIALWLPNPKDQQHQSAGLRVDSGMVKGLPIGGDGCGEGAFLAPLRGEDRNVINHGPIAMQRSPLLAPPHSTPQGQRSLRLDLRDGDDSSPMYYEPTRRDSAERRPTSAAADRHGGASTPPTNTAVGFLPAASPIKVYEGIGVVDEHMGGSVEKWRASHCSPPPATTSGHSGLAQGRYDTAGALAGRTEYTGSRSSLRPERHSDSPPEQMMEMKSQLSTLKRRTKARGPSGGGANATGGAVPLNNSEQRGRRALSANSALSTKPGAAGMRLPPSDFETRVGLGLGYSREPKNLTEEMRLYRHKAASESARVHVLGAAGGSSTIHTPRQEYISPEDRPIRPSPSMRQHSAPAERSAYSTYEIDYARYGPDTAPPGSKRSDNEHEAKRAQRQPKVSKATMRRREREEAQRANGISSPSGSSISTIDGASLPGVEEGRRFRSKRAEAVQRRAQPSIDTDIAEQGHDASNGVAVGPQLTPSHTYKPNSLKAETTYATTAELQARPFGNPEQALRSALKGFESGEWEQQVAALDMTRRLALNHTVVLGRQLHAIVLEVLKCLDNLRSSVSKNGLLTLHDLFLGIRRSMDPELDKVVPQLAKKSADTNVFLADQAQRSLDAMLQHCTDARVLPCLLNTANHRQYQVRAKIANLIAKCVRQIGTRVSQSRDFDRLVHVAVRFLGEGNHEVRVAGKQIMFELHQLGSIDDRSLARLLTERQCAKVKEVLAKGLDNLIVVNSRRGRVSTGISRKRRTSGSKIRSGRTKASDGVTATAGLEGRSALEGRGFRSGLAPRSGRAHSDGLVASEGAPTSFDPGSNRVRNQAALPDLSALQGYLRKIEANDWRQRHEAIDAACALALAHPAAMAETRQVLPLIDAIAGRLSDGNSKVNVFALQSLERVIPVLHEGFSTGLSSLIPALGANLASSNKNIQQTASRCMKTLLAYVEANEVVGQLVATMSYGNSKMKAPLLELIARSSVVPDLIACGRGRIAKLAGATFAVHEDAKGAVKEANNELLRRLHLELGSAEFWTLAGSLPAAQLRELRKQIM